MVFWRMSLREMQSRPVRTVLTLLSVIFGTSAVVSVSLTTATIRKAQSAMFSTLTGRTDLELIGEGGAVFDESVLKDVRQVDGVRAVVPSVFRSTVLFSGERKAKTQVLGIDPSIDEQIRTYELIDGKMIVEGNTIALDERFAKSMNVRVGDTVKLMTRLGLKEWSVAGLIRPQGGSALAQGGIVIAPLRAVQNAFRAKGKLDKIEVLVEESQDRDAIQKKIAETVPAGLRVKPPAQDNQVADQATNAAEQGLRLATAFALLIAVFIIFNTFQMVVGERRRQIGVLRAIGATRQQIATFVLNEAILLGTVGTILGVALGTGGAFLLTRSISQVLQSDMPDPQLSLMPVVIAAFFGIGIAWMGAFLPARRAGRLSPAEAMQVVVSSEMKTSRYRLPAVGAAMVATGTLLHVGCLTGVLSAKWSIPGSIIAMLGVVFLLPLIVAPTSRVVRWLISPFLGVEALLAHRQLLRHRSRTSLTTGVLFVAISTGLGLACTIIDNVRDIDLWMSRAILGDFFVRASMPDLSTGKSADLPEEVGMELSKIEGIRSLDALRFVNARSGDNSLIVVVRDFSDVEKISFDILEGDDKSILDGLKRGEVIVGSVFSERANLRLGDTMPLETLAGTKDFRIAGIVNDYIAGGLTIYMQRETAEQVFQIDGEDAFIVFAQPGRMAEVEAAVSTVCEKHGLLLQSNAELVELIRSMSRGVNGGLWGLLALGSAIASFGLINTLSMNIIEQTREIGLLRVVAMTRNQIRRMIFAQALLLSLVGFVPGTAMGILVAYLINLSTYTATGHRIEFVFRPGLATASFVVALAMALAASLIPAERASRIRLASALRYE
jgi:putative ABC transport system permease protein